MYHNDDSSMCYRPYRLLGGEGGSSVSARRGLTFIGNIAWNYPSASIHFTNESPKKYVSLIFEIYCR